MTPVLTNLDYADADAFIKALNAARQTNKDRWIVYVGQVAGRAVRIKSYNSGYLQVLEVDGVNHSPPMGMNVTAWKAAIRDALTR